MKGETTMHGLMLREGTPEEAGMDPARVERLRELLAGWVACGDTAQSRASPAGA
jgi:hypothetical protein